MRALIGVIMVLSVAACAQGWREDGVLNARTLDSDLQCGRDLSTGTATWIDNPDDFETAYKQLDRMVIETLATLPEMDFQRDGVLLIEMGRRPTAGYGISLAAETATLVDDTAQVIVHWTEPPPGAVAAQVITSPCVFIALTRGDYRRIEVHDDAGHLRAVVVP